MSGDLSPDLWEMAFRPPPAWPWTVERAAHAMPWSIPLDAVDFTHVALDLFEFLRVAGFSPAPRAGRIDPTARSIVWERADAFVVASLADDGSFWLTAGPRFGDPDGSPLHDRLLGVWGSDQALVSFGAVPVWAETGGELAGQLAPYRDAVRAAAADLFADQPLGFDRLTDALDGALDTLRRDRLVAYYRTRSGRAWTSRRWAAYVEAAERLVGLGEVVEADRLATARDHVRVSHPSRPADRSEADRVRRAAADLNEALRKVNATVSHRDRSDSAYADWEDSTVVLHRALESMYPGDFLQAIRDCRDGEPAAVERAITFLEVGPWCFRSGYVKEEILHRLKAAKLDERQQARLRRVVLSAVDAGDRREFRGYCRLARRLVDAGLRAGLRLRLHSSGPGVARRALWVLDAIREPLGPR